MEVQEDVAQLLRTLDASYPRELVTQSTWDTLRVRLIGAGQVHPTSPEDLCGRLGRALSYVPGAWARMAGQTERCMDRSVPDADRSPPREAPSIGPNIAAESGGLLVLDDADPRIRVLGVRHFAPPTDPGWRGKEAVLAEAAHAAALVVDLRGSSGSDPRALWPLIEVLADVAPLPPLVDIVLPSGGAAARLAHVERFGPPPRDLDVWRGLVGPHVPPALPAVGRPPKPIVVLVGPGCEEACQLVARTLETYARAAVRGEVSTSPLLAAGQPAVAEIERLGIEVLFPGAAFVLSPSFASRPSQATRWRTAWRERPPRDALPDVMAALGNLLDLHARIDRWRNEDPVPCAELPDATTWHALPAPVRRRIGSGWGWEPRTITVTLELPLERAREFLAGCPSIRVVGPGQTWHHGEVSSVQVAAEQYADVARVAQSDAIVVIAIEGESPLDPLP